MGQGLAGRIKEHIKKIGFIAKSYRWWKKNAPYLFNRGKKTKVIQGSLMYLNVWDRDVQLRKTFRAYVKAKVIEPSTTMLFNRVLNPGDTFFDIGANIGYFSLLASRLVGPSGKVFSFEPEPRNYMLLKRNKELNGYSHMTALNNAVSDRDTTVTLFVCPYDTGHHTIMQKDGIRSFDTKEPYRATDISEIKIPARAIDIFMSEQEIPKVNLIKLDVEGAEVLALQGMKNMLKKANDVKLVVEFFPLLMEKMGTRPQALVEFLTDLGFSIFEVPGDHDALSRKEGLILRKIADADELMVNYEIQPMYHVNLFVRKA